MGWSFFGKNCHSQCCQIFPFRKPANLCRKHNGKGDEKRYEDAVVHFQDKSTFCFWVVGRKAVRQITISDQSELILDWAELWQDGQFLGGMKVVVAR